MRRVFKTVSAESLSLEAGLLASGSSQSHQPIVFEKRLDTGGLLGESALRRRTAAPHSAAAVRADS